MNPTWNAADTPTEDELWDYYGDQIPECFEKRS